MAADRREAPCYTCGAPTIVTRREVVMLSSDGVTEIHTGIMEPQFTYAHSSDLAARPGERRFRDLLERERHDVAMLARNLAVIYDAISGGHVSKPNTDAEVVIGIFEERVNREIEEAIAEDREVRGDDAPPDPAALLREAARTLIDATDEMSEWDEHHGYIVNSERDALDHAVDAAWDDLRRVLKETS